MNRKSIASVDPFEIEIQITDAGRIGVWANDVTMKGSRRARAAGQLPAGDATAHSQLAVALSLFLCTLTWKQCRRLADANGVAKPRMKISLLKSDFAQAVNDRLLNLSDARRLRAASAIAADLLNRLRWFDITWDVLPDDASLISLREWSRRQVNDPRELKKIPAVLVPTAVYSIT